jgi:hypothetical protein
MIEPRTDGLSGHSVLILVAQTCRQQLMQLPHRRLHDLVNASGKSENLGCLFQLGLNSERIEILGQLQDTAKMLCCKRFDATTGRWCRLALASGRAAPNRPRSLRQRLPPFLRSEFAEPQRTAMDGIRPAVSQTAPLSRSGGRGGQLA